MRKKNPMTIQDHLKLAEHVRGGLEHFIAAFDIVADHFLISSRTYKALWRLIGFGGTITQIQGELDNHWHRLITDKEFDQYGHIYYGPPRATRLQDIDLK